MFKRIAALLLALALVFSFAACNKDGKDDLTQTGAPADLKLPEGKKIAILVAPEAQFPEDYQAAKALEAQYPNNVVVQAYADSRILKAGDGEIIQYAEKYAAMPGEVIKATAIPETEAGATVAEVTTAAAAAASKDIGAIIFARATRFTNYAITAAKRQNPDIITICIEPEESVADLAGRADLVLCADWSKAATEMVANAAAASAKYFVMFSFNRHLNNNEPFAALKTELESACKAKGITFVYDSSSDPESSSINVANNTINEAIPRLINNKKIDGEAVAIFSTDSAVQKTLVEQANKRGYIYVSPSFPTAYNGVAEAYSVKYDADTAKFAEAVKAAAVADAQGKGRFSVTTFPLASVLLKGAVYTAFDLLAGTVTAQTLSAKAPERVKSAANAKEGFTIEQYSKDYTNVFKAYCTGATISF